MFQAILPVVRPVAIAGARFAGGLAVDAVKYTGSVAAGLVIAGCMIHGLNKAETTLKAVSTRRRIRRLKQVAVQERATRKLLAANGYLHQDQMGLQLHAEIQRMIDNGRLVLVPDLIPEEHAA